MSKDTMSKDNMSKDNMSKDSMSKDSMKKDTMKKNPAHAGARAARTGLGRFHERRRFSPPKTYATTPAARRC
jgi:hypothetical protein